MILNILLDLVRPCGAPAQQVTEVLRGNPSLLRGTYPIVLASGNNAARLLFLQI